MVFWFVMVIIIHLNFQTIRARTYTKAPRYIVTITDVLTLSKVKDILNINYLFAFQIITFTPRGDRPCNWCRTVWHGFSV